MTLVLPLQADPSGPTRVWFDPPIESAIEPSAGHTIWFPAQTDAVVDTDAPDTAPTTTYRAVRPARTRLAVLLAALAIVIPMCAPLAWWLAASELSAIEVDAFAFGNTRVLRAIALCTAAFTFLGIGFSIGYPLGLLL